MVMSRLNPRYQEVLRAKYLNGNRVAGIAEALGVTEKAVESRLTRAREAYRREHERCNAQEES